MFLNVSLCYWTFIASVDEPDKPTTTWSLRLVPLVSVSTS